MNQIYLLIGFLLLFPPMLMLQRIPDINLGNAILLEDITHQEIAHEYENEKTSFFEFLSEQSNIQIDLSSDIKTIIKNFENKSETEGTVDIKTDNDAYSFNAVFDLGGKTRRKICKFPPVKINLKKKELEGQNFVKKCDRMKIVFQCNSSKSMAETIRKEKFVYDLHNLVTPYGHRALLVKVNMGDDDKLYDALILESDDDIEFRTDTEILKNRTIATNIIDREEYVKMCLFQYMISNADWSARKGHNTDLFKRNADNSLVVIPYDFDYSGLIGNHYAVPPENLPIEKVTQRYFMDKNITSEELQNGIRFFLEIENDVFNLIEGADYLSNGTKKSVNKFCEGFYKIIKNEKKVKRLIK